jgi:hypothetical protein
MTARALADVVVVLHALFVIFALFGGALILWQPRVAILHLPAAAWAAWVEFTGTICPLTPLENEWRHAAGAAGYEGGFVEHHLVPALYPDGLTPRMQVALGVVVVAVNASLYGFAWWRMLQQRKLALRTTPFPNSEKSRHPTRFARQSGSPAAAPPGEST